MDKNSLAHMKWECKYHIVFAPKYRRKIDLFSLWIGGRHPDSEPWYIYLALADAMDTRIDIRDGGVTEFISEHNSNINDTEETITYNGKEYKKSELCNAALHSGSVDDTNKGFMGMGSKLGMVVRGIPSGKYRIGKSIMDFRGTGDYETKNYYAEFRINVNKCIRARII